MRSHTALFSQVNAVKAGELAAGRLAISIPVMRAGGSRGAAPGSVATVTAAATGNAATVGNASTDAQAAGGKKPRRKAPPDTSAVGPKLDHYEELIDTLLDGDPSMAEIDAILVPGLAFMRAGHEAMPRPQPGVRASVLGVAARRVAAISARAAVALAAVGAFEGQLRLAAVSLTAATA